MATFVAALVGAALATLMLIQPGVSTRAFADDEATSITADESLAGEKSAPEALPSASTISGVDFLTALDAYVAANPAVDAGDYVEIDGDTPSFATEDATTEASRCSPRLMGWAAAGTAYACLGPETLPSEPREDISEVHPSGWVQNSYGFVEGESLYNRSHLIAFCLSGQNANEENLITGTRHFNADVMEPIEAMVLDYIEQTGNHVLYRVTPVFEGDELVARGVQIEALSMEDGGKGCRSTYTCETPSPAWSSTTRPATIGPTAQLEKTSKALHPQPQAPQRLSPFQPQLRPTKPPAVSPLRPRR